MPPLEEPDCQGVPLELELPDFTPGSPLSHPYQDSDAPINTDEYLASSADTLPEEDFKQEPSRAGIFGSPLANTEAGSDIHNAGLWQENFKYHATDNQHTDQEFETRVSDNSTSPIGALSPASEKLLQNANIIVSIPSPDVGSRFIQRHDTQEDVMEEIKSAFKFAKKENAHGPDKIISTKANRKALEPVKARNTLESTTVCKYNGST